ncbi:hypothetical protein C2L96_13850 [Bacillus cereus]|uniref:hypothetical protein n=1 Tax=Bacillus cereus group sp. Bc191 TaxID=3018113 RepID=UPI000CCBD723|nr:hypothetical protein [Bacillus cereus group sp. Bc191]MDA2289047.1 hypothetical protein [Bacillus cereus group sp. Bc191]PNU13126.1 hypothetical protein C2L96_13850 [Bacillus cereus]
MNKIDSFFESSLSTCKTLQLSLIPNIPGIDETVSFKLLSYNLKETVSGYLLELNLENLETKEQYTYTYNDIQKIEENGSSTHQNQKYYIYCLNRRLYSDKHRDQLLDGSKLDISYEDNSYIDMYRIMTSK